MKKKELKRVLGNPDSVEARMQRTGLSRPELMQHDNRFNKETFKKKRAPRTRWYSETPDVHIEGKK